MTVMMHNKIKNNITEDRDVAPDNKKGDTAFAAFAAFSQIGISMSACVVIGIFGGLFVDKRLGTSPIFMFFGSIIGTGASFKTLYDLATKKAKTNKKKGG